MHNLKKDPVNIIKAQNSNGENGHIQKYSQPVLDKNECSVLGTIQTHLQQGVEFLLYQDIIVEAHKSDKKDHHPINENSGAVGKASVIRGEEDHFFCLVGVVGSHLLQEKQQERNLDMPWKHLVPRNFVAAQDDKDTEVKSQRQEKVDSKF